MPKPGFAAVGIYRPGSDRPALMSAKGKVIVFDTAAVARHFLPLLGAGRLAAWSADAETISFSPLDPEGINRACILTGYDVYNLPPGLPVRSEAHGLAWKRHVYWAHWWGNREL